jgi:hypothetical protein
MLQIKTIRVETRHFPFYLFQTIISFNDTTAYGYGSDFDKKNAKNKSISEAWERLVFKNQNSISGAKIYSSTNGFACHPDEDLCRSKSIEELIERKILIDFWQQKAGWARAKPKSLYVKLLSKALSLQGWALAFYNVKSNIGSIVCLHAQHKTLGSFFDSSYGVGKGSEEKLICSIMKDILTIQPREILVMPMVGRPEDHKAYYQNIKNETAFDFLKSEFAAIDKLFIPDIDQIETVQLKLVSDQPAVFSSHNRKWNDLQWGLQSCTSSINPWPHPLA